MIAIAVFTKSVFIVNIIELFFSYFAGKKPALKSFSDIQALLSQGKKREVKLCIRENAWPINSTIRSQLWPALCSQHQVGKSMLEGYYWDMVNQVRLAECQHFLLFTYYYYYILFGNTQHLIGHFCLVTGVRNNRTARKTHYVAAICRFNTLPTIPSNTQRTSRCRSGG